MNGETGELGRRSVCVEYMYYNPDGTIQCAALSGGAGFEHE
jgi:hypothetical protein